jgi:hypothetical protein
LMDGNWIDRAGPKGKGERWGREAGSKFLKKKRIEGKTRTVL